MIDSASFGIRLGFELGLQAPDADDGFVDMMSGPVVAYHGEDEERR